LATVDDSLLQVVDVDPALRIALKYHSKDVVQLIRQWKYCLQEIRVPGESLICGILRRGLFPWITATCKVNKNNTEGPDVVGSASV
jgi:hypothetical protein